MEIVLVLGKQVLPSGDIPQDFIDALEKAAKIVRTTENTRLVISGGVTKPGYPAEADNAIAYLPKDVIEKTLIERQSLSTRQNILYTKKMLQDEAIDSLTIIVTAEHKERTAYLLGKLWPEIVGRTTFITIGDMTVGKHLFHKILFLMTVIDPQEKFFLKIKPFIW